MTFNKRAARALALGCAAALTMLAFGSDASASYFVALTTTSETGITNNATCNLSDAIDCVKGGGTGTANGATCTAMSSYHGCGGPPTDEYVFLNTSGAPTYLIGSTQVIPADVTLTIVGGDLPGDAFIRMTGTGAAFSVASRGIFFVNSLTILHSTATAGRVITNNGTCSLEYAGVADGKVTGTCDATNTGGCGGGIYNNGSLSLFFGSRVYHNSASRGGGIYSSAGATGLVVDHTLIGGDTPYTGGSGIRGNTATGDGGGIYNNSADSNRSIISSAISNNTAAGVGGGIASTGAGGITILMSTIWGNRAVNGGGLRSSGRAFIETSTFSGNTATTGGGGAIKVVPGVNNYLELYYSTVAFNHAQTIGGGVDVAGANSSGTATSHSIVAKNTFGAGNTASDYNGDPQSENSSKSLFGVTPTNTMFYNSGLNLTGDPRLAALAANGYSQSPVVKTHGIPSTSPAIDQVSNADASLGSDSDERGYTRACVNPGGLCDLGAFERQPSDP